MTFTPIEDMTASEKIAEVTAAFRLYGFGSILSISTPDEYDPLQACDVRKRDTMGEVIEWTTSLDRLLLWVRQWPRGPQT